jgi:N-acetylneuraminate synthase
MSRRDFEMRIPQPGAGRHAVRRVGAGHPCFVIAEAGVNHNGEIDQALRLIDAAAEAGADACKFQTFSADRLVTRHADKAAYQKETTGAGESQHAMLKRLELSPADHERLLAHATARGLTFLSTPFDPESLDLLVTLGVPAIKIGSGEITNLPLLELAARAGKPIILSTGMSYLGEVERAVRAIQAQGEVPLVLLHCVSSYPARPADVNLRAMATLQQAFGLPVGYSDHTLGIAVTIAAIALGACVIEKHFTLDRTLPGPDHRASLEPAELAAMVRAARDVEAALGDGQKRPTPGEMDTIRVARKSIVSSVEIPAGTTITARMLAIKRPGTGISPAEMDRVIGRVARTSIPADTVVEWEML